MSNLPVSWGAGCQLELAAPTFALASGHVPRDEVPTIISDLPLESAAERGSGRRSAQRAGMVHFARWGFPGLSLAEPEESKRRFEGTLLVLEGPGDDAGRTGALPADQL